MWAVGEYANGGVTQTLTMHYNGTAWSIVSSPNSGSGYNQLAGVTAVASNDVWAVGTSGDKGLTEHWNGSGWSVVPSPSPTNVTLRAASSTSATDVWAVGDSPAGFFSEHWNGTAWTAVTIPTPTATFDDLNGVWAVGAADVWAVGSVVSGSTTSTVAEHWNGTAWSIVPTASPGFPNELHGVAATSGGDVWAVGAADGTLVEHWTGSSFDRVSSETLGAGPSAFRGVQAFSATDVWGVGYTEDKTLTEHWNGSAFTIVPSPNQPDRNNVLEDVDGVASTDMWAVGHADVKGDIGAITLAEHWNGSAWTIVPTPNLSGSSTHNELTGVATIAPTDAWAVGSATDYSPGGHALTYHWDGSAWRSVRNSCGVGLSEVAALGSNDVWAVGGTNTCHWNGTRWTRFPAAPAPDGQSGINLVDVTTVSTNDVWAVGLQYSSCGEGQVCPTGEIQHWNGSAWSHVANPVPVLYGIDAIAANDIYAVGLGYGPAILHYDGTSWVEVPSGTGAGELRAVEASGPKDIWAAGDRTGSLLSTLVEHAPSPTSGAVVGHTNVSFATVSWFGPESGSVETDPFGDYEVGGLTAGKYTFTATNPGCQPATAKVTVIAGTTIEKDFVIPC